MYSMLLLGAARIIRKSAHFSPVLHEPLTLSFTPALRGDAQATPKFKPVIAYLFYSRAN